MVTENGHGLVTELRVTNFALVDGEGKFTSFTIATGHPSLTFTVLKAVNVTKINLTYPVLNVYRYKDHLTDNIYIHWSCS